MLSQKRPMATSSGGRGVTSVPRRSPSPAPQAPVLASSSPGTSPSLRSLPRTLLGSESRAMRLGCRSPRITDGSLAPVGLTGHGGDSDFLPFIFQFSDLPNTPLTACFCVWFEIITCYLKLPASRHGLPSKSSSAPPAEPSPLPRAGGGHPPSAVEPDTAPPALGAPPAQLSPPGALRLCGAPVRTTGDADRRNPGSLRRSTPRPPGLPRLT